MDRGEAVALATRIKRSSRVQEIIELCDYVLAAPARADVQMRKPDGTGVGYRDYMRDYMRKYRERKKAQSVLIDKNK